MCSNHFPQYHILECGYGTSERAGAADAGHRHHEYVIGGFFSSGVADTFVVLNDRFTWFEPRYTFLAIEKLV
jgi:hypothetical protein